MSEASTSAIHVLPSYDVRKHVECELCWCRPRLEKGDHTTRPVIVHNLFLDPDADDPEYVM